MGDEILDRWNAAIVAHRTAPNGQKDRYYLAMLSAEHEAAGHFGIGKHIAAYNARFPDDPI